jgi:hypothetical protein
MDLINSLANKYNKLKNYPYSKSLATVGEFAKDTAKPIGEFIANAPIVKSASAFLDNPTPQEFGAQVANLGSAISDSAQEATKDPMSAVLNFSPMAMGTIIGKGAKGLQMAEQKIFRGDPTPITLEKYNPNAGIEAGKELGQSMAEGPGIYFTTHPKNAASYGKNITEANLSTGAKIIDKHEKPLSRASINSMLNKVDKETLDNALSNWDENPRIARNMLLDAIHENATPQEQLMSIWADVFYHQSPDKYMDLMAKSKIAGMEIEKEGLSHFVVYDKKALSNIKYTAEDFLDK